MFWSPPPNHPKLILWRLKYKPEAKVGGPGRQNSCSSSQQHRETQVQLNQLGGFHLESGTFGAPKAVGFFFQANSWMKLIIFKKIYGKSNVKVFWGETSFTEFTNILTTCSLSLHAPCHEPNPFSPHLPHGMVQIVGLKVPHQQIFQIHSVPKMKHWKSCGNAVRIQCYFSILMFLDFVCPGHSGQL